MADETKVTEITQPVAPAATEVVVDAAPAATETTTPTEITAAPIVETTAQPETKPIPVAENAQVEEKSILGDDAPKTETAPTDAPKEGTTEVKDESKQSDEPAPLPTYEPFKLPEGFKVDETKLSEFSKELAEFETKNKADHAEVQALGQKLIERHTAEMQRVQEANLKQWDEITKGWKESFEKDPEIGGNRRDTTVKAVQQAVETYAGSPEHLTEFRTFVNETKTGEHPAFIRLVHNMDKALKEKDSVIQMYKTKYESEEGIKPLAGTKPEPSKSLKPYEKMYGQASNNL